ncbi:Ribosomal RNA large subunit methyltransferase L [Hondaea fermentalgiana]|uniref:Ribosomal RNA large subunit methyltransferase L n=1 Tax=Hondaea fermentalgiana TaxID=2315210 RepID=A0A2R5GRH1_9STRA|nr:Ribosomal RNA large subunit methyltransferase L [Hondaea fermentalgiana]|eukprot:GBG30941.1 Ribosomal RNA large subunit methyltransferase L [Hondaea fermentalgiana]
MRPRELFAVAAPGLEALTLRELQTTPFGNFSLPKALAGGIDFRGHDQAIYRANLWLRTSSRVLVRVGHGKSTHKKELVQKLRRMDWTPFLQPRDTKLIVRASSKKSKLINTALLEEAVKSALDRYSNERSANEQEIVISFKHDQFTVSINSSGDNLHKRWYRQQVATPMPLRETLAAGAHLSSWAAAESNPDSDVKLPSAIVDPFCGSGTLPIEAALILATCAPGLVRLQQHPNRAYAFADWPSFDGQRFAQVIEEAMSVRKDRPPQGSGPIAFGFDRERAAVEIAEKCAARAGVQDWCAFEQRDITVEGLALPGLQLDSMKAGLCSRGAIVTNPPYGPRFKGPIQSIFTALGSQLKEHCKGWQLALIAPADFPGIRTLGQSGLSHHHAKQMLEVTNGGRRMKVFATPEVV